MITKFKLYENKINDIYHMIFYLDEFNLKKYIANGGILKSSPNKESLLHYCVEYGDYNIMKILLESNQFSIDDINEYNEFKSTILMQSVKLNKYKISELLIKYGANPNLQNKDGLIALNLTSDEKYVDLLAPISDWSIKINNKYNVFEYLSKAIKPYLIKNFPEKYKKYLREKQAKKFKI